jgi:hypothetical protein
LLVSTGQFTWPQAIELVKKERPELTSRLPKEDLEPTPQTVAPMDSSFAAEVLGLKEYIPWQTSFLDNLDTCIEWEKGVASA